MKRMRLIFVLCLIVVVASFAACSGNNDATTGSDGSTSDSSTEESDADAAQEEFNFTWTPKGEPTEGVPIVVSEYPTNTKGPDDDVEIVFCAKVEGVQWFDMIFEGMKQYAETNPRVKVTVSSPDSADAAKQASIIEDCVARGVDAICVVPIDQDAVKPSITKAREAGIVVIMNEGEELLPVANYNIETYSHQMLGEAFGKRLAEELGGEGEWVMMVGGLTQLSHMIWFDVCKSYLAENYPDIKLIEQVPYEDKNDAKVGYDKFKEILQTHPDLDGFVSATIESLMSAGRYLEEINKTDMVIGGLGLPSTNGEALKNGFCQFAICADPYDQGWALAKLAHLVILGEEIKAPLNLDRIGYTKCEVWSSGEIFGDEDALIEYTAENVDQYDY